MRARNGHRPVGRTKLVVIVVAVAAVVGSTLIGSAGGAVSVVRGPTPLASQSDVSSNWAGYVATGPGSTKKTASPKMAYTDVTGQWVQPKAICAPGTPSSVAIWVGLGGYSEKSKELEQTGTSADCSESGKASYYIWYELVPADSVNVNLSTLKISPGDVIAAVVEVNGTHVLVQVIDRTRRTRFTKHLSAAKLDLTSAEWIAEAPSQCGESRFCSQLSLTNFRSIKFTHAFATGNGVGSTMSSPDWMVTALQLVPRSRRFFGGNDSASSSGFGGAGASPSPLRADGKGFSITWDPSPAAPRG